MLWSVDHFWIFLCLCLVGLNAVMVGQHLSLRRESMLGDALSHAVLPGLVVSFLLTGSLRGFSYFFGALGAALVAVFLSRVLKARGFLKEDAAIGITYAALFSAGILMINFFARQVDLDPSCIFFGELNLVPLEARVQLGGVSVPISAIKLLAVFFVVLLLTQIFKRAFVFTAFDAGGARATAFPVFRLELLLFTLIGVVLVTSFSAVGSILVLAFMSIPMAVGRLYGRTLSQIFAISLLTVLLAAFLGSFVALRFDLNIAATAATFLFLMLF